MKIFILADNIIGLEVVKFLKRKKENVVGLAVHSKKFQNLSKEIIKASGLKKYIILKKKVSKENLNIIKKTKPDVILVVFWRHLLDKNLFSIPKYGCINFHLGLLPFNRGTNPNVWPLIENTPAGCTIHKIDKNIDSGEIICQKKTNYDILDTGETLYYKILEDFKSLFKQNWQKMKKKNFKGKKQNLKKGSIHFRSHFKKISKIKMNKMYYPIELFNLLRAKMFKPHDPAYFIYKGDKYFVRINIKKIKK